MISKTFTQVIRAIEARIPIIFLRTYDERTLFNELAPGLISGYGHRFMEFQPASGMRETSVDESRLLSPKSWTEWDRDYIGAPSGVISELRKRQLDMAKKRETNGKPPVVWCKTHRLLWDVSNSESPCPAGCNAIREGSNITLVLRGMTPYLDEDSQNFDVALARNLWEAGIDVITTQTNLIVTLEPGTPLPDDLLRFGTVIDDELPDREEIENMWAEFAKAVTHSARRARLLKTLPADNPDSIAKVVNRLSGLSTPEIRNALTTASTVALTSSKEDIAPEFLEVLQEKKVEGLKKSAALEVHERVEAWQLGGLDQLKEWLLSRAAVLTPEAREHGIPLPRGILLLGIPGVGKSLGAKVIADILDLPLFSLDFGALFGKYVGTSEGNIRRALKTVEAASPCVLHLDEIEKAMGSAGDSDGGTSSRVFGKFLTWMNDRPQDQMIFVVATANNIAKLPPEMLRKGRFDEIWFTSLPNYKERLDIFNIHLKKARLSGGKAAHSLNAADVETAADSCSGFVGAEIAQAVVAARITAFREKSPVLLRHITHELQSTKPLSVTMAEKITSMQSWAKDRARLSSTPGDMRRKVAPPVAFAPGTTGNFGGI